MLMHLHKNIKSDVRHINSFESKNGCVESLTSEYRTNPSPKITKGDFIIHLKALAKSFERFAESNPKFQDLCENDKMELYTLLTKEFVQRENKYQ